ncbi:MAG: Ldh family oxidoreductase [Chloroflexi bacterium]|nr:Ldh family oxidoreductase [Chloroflexota bacterium]
MEYVARVAAETLHAFTREVFERAGFSPQHAADGADVLLWASRRGVDTHGVRNLKLIYLRMLEEGRINPNAIFSVEHETPVSARVDGDGGLGLAAACWAMRLAMDKAEQSGMAFVTMRNSYHYGAAGYYPAMALSRDMIGISLTGRFSGQGVEIGVLPTFGSKPMFSTNPIAVAFPTQTEAPWVLDMATSIAPYNRVILHRENGLPVLPQWGLTAEGEPTADALLMQKMWPLGGDRAHGGHKGYGLSMLVATMCAVLSGGWDDGHDGDETAFNGYRQTGDSHFFGAIRIDAFRPVESFKRGMDAMIQALHAAPKAQGLDRIYVAGEIEHETEQKRSRDGIPLTAATVADLREVAEKYGMELEI